MSLVIDNWHLDSVADVLITVKRVVLQGFDTMVHLSIVCDMCLVPSPPSNAPHHRSSLAGHSAISMESFRFALCGSGREADADADAAETGAARAVADVRIHSSCVELPYHRLPGVPLPAYALATVSGTDAAYSAMRPWYNSILQDYAAARHYPVLQYRMGLCACYAVSGTDSAYGATRSRRSRQPLSSSRPSSTLSTATSLSLLPLPLSFLPSPSFPLFPYPPSPLSPLPPLPPFSALPTHISLSPTPFSSPSFPCQPVDGEIAAAEACREGVQVAVSGAEKRKTEVQLRYQPTQTLCHVRY